MRSIVVAAAAVATVIATIPTVKLCNHDQTCLDMPVVGQGSCCGTYNISSWLSQVGAGAHIDTSCDYGSQPTIATAIQGSNIPRNQLWITSKLNVESCGTNMTQALYEQVLDPLQTTYVDLLLLHHAGRWETDNNPHPPCFDLSLANGNGTYYNCRIQTIAAFEALRALGLIKSWGVSNWGIRDLQQAHDVYGYYPPLNQIEFHPYWQSREVVSFCNRNGILVEAYAPYGDGDRSHMRDDPVFPPIAAAHGATVGQTILTWELQVGADIVIPRSANASHQGENLALFSPAFTLNETEVAAIGSVHQYSKVYHTDCQPWC